MTYKTVAEKMCEHFHGRLDAGLEYKQAVEATARHFDVTVRSAAQYISNQRARNRALNYAAYYPSAADFRARLALGIA